MARRYVVMCKVYTDTDRESEIPLSGTMHAKRFSAFLEMEHAKDNPQYAGETFYIKEVSEWINIADALGPILDDVESEDEKW